MRKIAPALMLLIATTTLYGWKSAETKGDQPTFFGKLTTQEDNSFYITNITFGTSNEEHEKIMLYEKPKNMAPSPEGNVLPGNPYKDLSTTTLELQKIKKLEVPDPQTTWKWVNTDSQRVGKLSIEFIEVVVTWRTGTASPYLLELGVENSRRPVKLFCDVIEKEVIEAKEGNSLVCPGVKKEDARTKGAPFQSIKMVEIEEPCYKLPDNACTMKSENN